MPKSRALSVDAAQLPALALCVLCLHMFVCACERARGRRGWGGAEERALCLCEPQHHHSAKILLTTDCRVPVRTSWLRERGEIWDGLLGFIYLLLVFFYSFGDTPQLSEMNSAEEGGLGSRGRIWKDKIKVKTGGKKKMNPAA